MTQRADVWMPFYVADYLKDTRHLSTLEHGAYMLLLMSAWAGGGVLPLDERRLRRIAGMDEGEWAESGLVLLAFFTTGDGGYRHKRVDAELERAEANREQKRAAGRVSAARRAAGKAGTDPATAAATPVATDVGTDVPTAGQREGNSSPSPSPSSSSKQTDSADEPKRAKASPDALSAVMKAGGMIRHPVDHHLLSEWLALPDMQLERDILPIVTRVGAEVLERTAKAPFKLKLFDAAIREQHAADQAEMARLRRVRERAERMNREQAA